MNFIISIIYAIIYMICRIKVNRRVVQDYPAAATAPSAPPPAIQPQYPNLHAAQTQWANQSANNPQYAPY